MKGLLIAFFSIALVWKVVQIPEVFFTINLYELVEYFSVKFIYPFSTLIYRSFCMPLFSALYSLLLVMTVRGVLFALIKFL
jgi:hypothetical protein